MLIVFASLKIKGGQPGRLKVARLLNILATASRQEPGCLIYSPAMSTEDLVTITVTEVWPDQAALEAHFKTPHFKQFLADAGGDLDGPPDIKTYDAIEMVSATAT